MSVSPIRNEAGAQANNRRSKSKQNDLSEVSEQLSPKFAQKYLLIENNASILLENKK